MHSLLENKASNLIPWSTTMRDLFVDMKWASDSNVYRNARLYRYACDRTASDGSNVYWRVNRHGTSWPWSMLATTACGHAPLTCLMLNNAASWTLVCPASLCSANHCGLMDLGMMCYRICAFVIDSGLPRNTKKCGVFRMGRTLGWKLNWRVIHPNRVF